MQKEDEVLNRLQKKFPGANGDILGIRTISTQPPIGTIPKLGICNNFNWTLLNILWRLTTSVPVKMFLSEAAKNTNFSTCFQKIIHCCISYQVRHLSATTQNMVQEAQRVPGIRVLTSVCGNVTGRIPASAQYKLRASHTSRLNQQQKISHWFSTIWMTKQG